MNSRTRPPGTPVLDKMIVASVVAMVLLAIAAFLHPVLSGPPAPPGSALPRVHHAAVTTDQIDLHAVKVVRASMSAQLLAQQALAVPKPSTPPPAPPRPAVTPSPAVTPTPAPVAAPVVAPVSGTDYAATPFGACVRAREHGGSYSWLGGNDGGAYQFLSSTWYGNGAAPGTFGNASPAYQDEVFNMTVAHDGDAPWRPYDGCAL